MAYRVASKELSPRSPIRRVVDGEAAGVEESRRVSHRVDASAGRNGTGRGVGVKDGDGLLRLLLLVITIVVISASSGKITPIDNTKGHCIVGIATLAAVILLLGCLLIGIVKGRLLLLMRLERLLVAHYEQRMKKYFFEFN